MYDVYIKNYKNSAGNTVTTETKMFGVPIIDNDDPVIDPVVKNELGKTGTFEFSLYPTHPFYDAFLQMKTIMRVVYDGTTIFRGRVLTIDNVTAGTKKIHCEGDLAFLIDSIQEATKSENRTKTTIYAYLTSIIEAHNTQMSEAGETYKQFTIGEVPGHYSQSILPAQRITIEDSKFGSDSWQTTSNAISGLMDEYGGYFRTRYVNGTVYLDWLEAYFSTNPNTQAVAITQSIIDIQSSSEVDNLFTAVIPVGSASGKNLYIEGYRTDIHGNNKRILVPQIVDLYSDAELNTGYHNKSEYQNAVNKYGIIYKVQKFEDASTQEELWTKAVKWIKENYFGGITSFTINNLDWHHINGNFQKHLLGDEVTVIYPDFDSGVPGQTIQKQLTINQIEYNLYGPEKNSYTIGIPSTLLKTKNSKSKKSSEQAAGSDDKTDSDLSGLKSRLEDINEEAWRYIINATKNNPEFKIIEATNSQRATAILMTSHLIIGSMLNQSPFANVYYDKIIASDGTISFPQKGPPYAQLSPERKAELNQDWNLTRGIIIDGFTGTLTFKQKKDLGIVGVTPKTVGKLLADGTKMQMFGYKDGHYEEDQNPILSLLVDGGAGSFVGSLLNLGTDASGSNKNNVVVNGVDGTGLLGKIVTTVAGEEIEDWKVKLNNVVSFFRKDGTSAEKGGFITAEDVNIKDANCDSLTVKMETADEILADVLTPENLAPNLGNSDVREAILEIVGSSSVSPGVISWSDPRTLGYVPTDGFIWVKRNGNSTWGGVNSSLKWSDLANEYQWNDFYGCEFFIYSEAEGNFIRVGGEKYIVQSELESVLNQSLFRRAFEGIAINNDHLETLGSKIEQNAYHLRSEFWAADSSLYSVIEQTASDIRQFVRDEDNSVRSSILETANSIRIEVSKKNRIFYGWTDPSTVAENRPINVGDEWYKTKETDNWDAIGELPWENIHDASWAQVAGAEKYTWNGTGWILTNAYGEDLINGARLLVTEDKIAGVVSDIEHNFSSLVQTSSMIRSYVADINNGLSSSITQTASMIKSEVMDEVNCIRGSIVETANSIRVEVAKRARTFYGWDDPSLLEENLPMRSGDEWYKTNNINSYSDAADIKWGEMSSFEWTQVAGGEKYTWDDFKERWVLTNSFGEDILNGARLLVTEDKIAAVVSDVEHNFSSLVQTSSMIRSYVADINNGLSSSITQTASMIKSEVMDEFNSIKSMAIQTATSIELIVDSTSGAVTPAKIIAAINNDHSELLLSADKINLTGNIQLSGVLTADSSHAFFTGRTVYAKNFSVGLNGAVNFVDNADDTLSSLNGNNVPELIKDIQVIQDPSDSNRYKLQVKTIGASDTWADITNGSFSRATTLTDTWGSGNNANKYTVSASPQGVSKSDTVHIAASGGGSSNFSVSVYHTDPGVSSNEIGNLKRYVYLSLSSSTREVYAAFGSSSSSASRKAQISVGDIYTDGYNNGYDVGYAVDSGEISSTLTKWTGQGTPSVGPGGNADASLSAITSDGYYILSVTVHRHTKKYRINVSAIS